MTKKEHLFDINKEMFPSLSEGGFDRQTFDSADPVLVLFGAERCKVCKELQPALEEIVLEYKGNFRSYFVDVDENKELMKRFRLRGIPTLLFFNKGEVRDRIAGLRTKEELIEFINKGLSGQ